MTTPIIKINGIGLRTAEILVENGYKCAEDLAATSEDALSKIHGFGPVRAKLVIKTAQALCGAKSEPPKVDADTTTEDFSAVRHLEKKDKTNKKSKKKKKSKGDKKKKKEEKQKKAPEVEKTELKIKKKKKKKKK